METAHDFYTRAVEGELFQEQLHKDPYWMLVACMLVNVTTWKKAEPVFATMLKKSKGDPRWLLRVDEEFLLELLTPLGLQQNRFDNLLNMTAKFFEIEPESRADVLDLPGCGIYAAHSWAIFVEKDYTVMPSDKDLKAYLEKIKIVGPSEQAVA